MAARVQRSATNRKKKLPDVDRADLTGDELLQIVKTAGLNVANISNVEADLTARAINAIAYFGLASHELRSERRRVLSAAQTLRQYLDDLGYPMVDQLATLHVTLEAAMPFLLPPGWEPKSTPYAPAAITVHVHSCALCAGAGLTAATTRHSMAVRITAAILTRLGYNATPGMLELFFSAPKLKSAFADVGTDLQNDR